MTSLQDSCDNLCSHGVTLDRRGLEQSLGRRRKCPKAPTHQIVEASGERGRLILGRPGAQVPAQLAEKQRVTACRLEDLGRQRFRQGPASYRRQAQERLVAGQA